MGLRRQRRPASKNDTLPVEQDLLARQREIDFECFETYRSLVESAADPMFTSDVDGRFLYVNVAAAAQLGSTPEQVMGKTVDELFPPDVAELYRSGVQHVIRTGETLISEERSETRGRPAWFSSVVQPVRDHQGHIKAAQAVVRDITSLKDAEQALRQNEERLRQAVRVADIGMFDHDHVTNAVYESPKLREIFGLGPDKPIFGGPTDSHEARPLELVATKA